MNSIHNVTFFSPHEASISLLYTVDRLAQASASVPFVAFVYIDFLDSSLAVGTVATGSFDCTACKWHIHSTLLPLACEVWTHQTPDTRVNAADSTLYISSALLIDKLSRHAGPPESTVVKHHTKFPHGLSCFCLVFLPYGCCFKKVTTRHWEGCKPCKGPKVQVRRMEIKGKFLLCFGCLLLS